MVLVIGESLIDRITDADGVVHDVLGGGPFNAARALASLGCDTTFVGGISEDSFGNDVAAQLELLGVRVELPRVPQPTGVAYVTLDQAGAAEYRFDLEKSACAQVEAVDVAALIHNKDFAAIHVGTLGLVLQPLSDAVLALVQRVNSDALCFLDPNCRPALISDRAAYLRQFHSVLVRADVVKVSTEDLDFIAPGEDAAVVAARLCMGRTQVVLLTRGSEGVDVFTSDGVHRVPAASAHVEDTVGAGDVFGAAWLAWWLQQGLTCDELCDTDKVLQAARYGVKAAAWTVAHVGAQVPAVTDLENIVND